MRVNRKLLSILLAFIFIIGSGTTLAAAQTQASATIYEYDDGSAQLVINMTSNENANVSGVIAVVAKEDSVVINFSLSGKITQNYFDMDMYYSVEMKGTDNGYKGKGTIEVRSDDGTLRADIKSFEVTRTDNKITLYQHIYLEATGNFTDVVDSIHDALSNISTADLPEGVTLDTEIKEYERGAKIEYESTITVPEDRTYYISSLTGSLGMASDIVYTDIFKEGLKLDKAAIGAEFHRDGQFRMWAYLKVTGNISKLVEEQGLEGLENILSDTQGNMLDVMRQSGLDTGYTLGHALYTLQKKDVKVVLPTYYGVEVKNNKVTIALPRVKAANNDTVALLQSIAEQMGIENVETKKGDPTSPAIDLPDEAESELSGGLLSSDTLLLAGIVVVIIAVAAVLVLKARG